MQEQATEDIRTMVDDTVEAVRGRVDDARTEFESIDRQLRAFAEERPMLALLSAAAAGFVLARLLARR
jgi:hypothetical protein